MAKTSPHLAISTAPALPISLHRLHNNAQTFPVSTICRPTRIFSRTKYPCDNFVSTVSNPRRTGIPKPNAGPDSLTTMADVVPFFTLSENSGYSAASYYTSLGLFVLSLPGLWSLIKRSTKSKIVQKTFIVTKEDGKAPSQIAGEVLSFFTRNNFVVVDRGETITFEGNMVPSRGQASFLTFCTCISLASVALVLTITVPDVGDKWYWLTALSPLAGVYYWKRASRKEQIKVKMLVVDDESSTDVTVQGDDEQVDQLRRELKLMEKGMVVLDTRKPSLCPVGIGLLIELNTTVNPARMKYLAEAASMATMQGWNPGIAKQKNNSYSSSRLFTFVQSWMNRSNSWNRMPQPL
eukprot:Gb_25718 [translate_table: standard]